MQFSITHVSDIAHLMTSYATEKKVHMQLMCDLMVARIILVVIYYATRRMNKIQSTQAWSITMCSLNHVLPIR